VSRFVVAERDLPGAQVTFDASNGCERLEQRVLRLAPGDSLAQESGALQDVLYVVSGRGTLGGRRLEPDTAVLVGPGQHYKIEADDELKLLSVRTPASGGGGVRTVRFADVEERRADEKRTFRVLLETDVTQFVGLVEPCRAPDHSHPYDEVGYILEGRGFAHVGGDSIAIGPGSCFHLPPQEVHCIENTGPGVMRILGVFFPSGSPKQRAYEASGT
jgi:mannose-6-phosphate isomerase-like protein (cupin superfamily)